VFSQFVSAKRTIPMRRMAGEEGIKEKSKKGKFHHRTNHEGTEWE
jgi:hypothetical protein